MDDQDNSGQEQDNLAGQVMDNVGMPEEAPAAPETGTDGGMNDDPHGIKKRLGMQAKKHQREMRMMQEQLMNMQQQAQAPAQPPMQPQAQPMQSPTGQPQGQDQNAIISQAVAAALRAKEDHEKQLAKQMQEKEHNDNMAKAYQGLNDSFDKASEKYDDFDDVVRHPDAPFTPVMRDYALTLENPADVLYKLGKNPEELKRISKLPAMQQAKEMQKLSFALMGGQAKPQVESKPMGQIKGNPVASHAVTEKTSVGDIRKRMKDGGWK